MKLLESMIAWTPTTGAWAEPPYKPGSVRIGPWPDKQRWSDAYAMTEGACDAEIRKSSPIEQSLAVFMIFNKMVIRDGIDAEVAHEEFLKLDEYRERLSPDTPGADGQE